MDLTKLILSLKRANLRLSRNLEQRAGEDRQKKDQAWTMVAAKVKEDLEQSYKIESKSKGDYGPRIVTQGERL